MSPAHLAAAVAQASWDVLLPPHRSAGDDRPSGRPALADALDLGAGRGLAVGADASGRTYGVPLVAGGGAVRRAAPGDGAAEALLAVLAGGSRAVGRFELTSWTSDVPGPGEAGFTVDQTNQSVVVGQTAVVKWTHLVTPGPHPAPTVLEHLVAAGFTGTPRPWGLVQWRPAGEAPRLVVSVDAFLPGAEDGWTWAVADLRASVTGADPSAASASSATVGRLVAELHLALAGTARPAGVEDVAGWAAAGSRDLHDALADTTGDAHALLALHEPALRAALALPGTSPGGPVVLGHGDLHVGQVLRAGATYAVVDFDGNPVVPAEERLLPQPAAVDVAGMAQSLHHVGLVLRKQRPELDVEAVRAATSASVAAFLGAYRAALAAAGRADLLDESLLAPLRLRQVCREFSYAARHLPRWGYVPSGALPELLEGQA